MASIAEYRAAIEAARQKQVTVQGATFTLRLPHQHEWRRAAEANRDTHGNTMQTVAFRQLLLQAIVQWSNVPIKWIEPGAGDGMVDWSEDARLLLLDARQDIADLLTIELSTFRRDFDARFEALSKN